MKKINIAESFRTKKTRYGGYATLMATVVIAILVVVNLIVGKLDWKADLTKNKLYSISEQTNKILDGLQKDINIYVFQAPGKEDKTVSTILNTYKGRSNKIKIEYRDPVRYPQFVKKYSAGGEDVSEGSIVVESGSKFRLISPWDLANYSYSQTGQPQPESLAIEQRVTSAILYVTSEKNPVIYALQGHGETAVPDEVKKQLEYGNYTIQDLNLQLKDAQIDSEGALMVMSATKDLLAEEAEKIKAFLANGGRAIFLMDLVPTEMPNFQSVLNSYGIGLQKVIVVEGNPNYAANNPIYLFPAMGSHEIISPLKSGNLPVVLPLAQGIETLSIKKASTTITPLLTTSKNSWGKKNLETTTVEKESGDLNGPFNVAVAVSDSVDDKETKIVVVANSVFVGPQFAGNGGNLDFLMNSINWMNDQKDNISIAAKSLDTGILNMNTLQRLLFSGIVVVLIPLSIIIYGVMVWLRRRHQ